MPAQFIDLTREYLETGKRCRVAVAHIVTLSAEMADGSGRCQIVTTEDRFSVAETLDQVEALIADDPSEDLGDVVDLLTNATGLPRADIERVLKAIVEEQNLLIVTANAPLDPTPDVVIVNDDPENYYLFRRAAEAHGLTVSYETEPFGYHLVVKIPPPPAPIPQVFAVPVGHALCRSDDRWYVTAASDAG